MTETEKRKAVGLTFLAFIAKCAQVDLSDRSVAELLVFSLANLVRADEEPEEAFLRTIKLLAECSEVSVDAKKVCADIPKLH